MSRFRMLVLTTLLVAIAGCGDGGGPGQTVLNCDDVEPTVLAPGQLALVDATEAACLRLQESGTSADYLYLAYSAASEESVQGTAAEYRLTGSAGGAPVAVTRPGSSSAQLHAAPAQRFHDKVRAMGRDLARRRAALRVTDRATRPAAVPPVVGETRTFNVLRDVEVSGNDPDDYVQVEGTARYVGTRVAIFLDNAVPTEGGYTSEDIDSIGSLFDDHLYPISVSAFGSETDVNGDGVVLVLLSDRVTRLGGCGAGFVVVGYFFAVDLFEDQVGSNDAEIFYGLTPDESCGIDRDFATSRLPGVFIHEFQHMINYGQHVILRDGDAEDTWLDEGLATFAEELAGRLVPNDRCVENDCLTQFQLENLTNASNYLAQVRDAYLIGPRRPPLPLTQYGADWLFVRWLVDHFAAEQPLGADFTRSLVQTTRSGAENVSSTTGTPFDRLIGEWQIANFLEDHPEFLDISDGTHFEYTSWNLRSAFAALQPGGYPLRPDIFNSESYSRSGTLRAGSGQHVLVEQPAGAVVDLRLTDPDGTEAPPAAVVPRTAVLRLR